MKLVCRRGNGEIFTTNLPRRKTKHRIPQIGSVVRFDDDNSTFEGEVVMVEQRYNQVLGVLNKTEVVVSVAEFIEDNNSKADNHPV